MTGTGNWPSAEDSLPRSAADPADWHVRERADCGLPIMGSSLAEQEDSLWRMVDGKAAGMQDHLFAGDGQYCEEWVTASSVGDLATTGTVTMRIGCGHPRYNHPLLDT